MASEYVPGPTITVAIPLFCAEAIAALMAVNCAEPSVATVNAVTLGTGDVEAVETVDVPVALNELIEEAGVVEVVDELP